MTTERAERLGAHRETAGCMSRVSVGDVALIGGEKKGLKELTLKKEGGGGTQKKHAVGIGVTA